MIEQKAILLIKQKILDFYAPYSRGGVVVDIITNKVITGSKQQYHSTLHLNGVAISRGADADPYYAMLDLITNLALQGAALTLTLTEQSQLTLEKTASKLMASMQMRNEVNTKQLEFDFTKLTFEQMNPFKIK